MIAPGTLRALPACLQRLQTTHNMTTWNPGRTRKQGRYRRGDYFQSLDQRHLTGLIIGPLISQLHKTVVLSMNSAAASSSSAPLRPLPSGS